MHPVQYVIQKLNQQQSIYLNSSLVSVWKNLTHGHTQQNKNRHRRRKWKMKVPPLGDQAEGAALWAHTPPFLTTKQPEQLAAPLEPGGGKKSCKENGGVGGESDTEKLGGSCSTARHSAVMWSVPTLHDAEAISGRSWWTADEQFCTSLRPERTYKLLLISFCHLLGCQAQE